MKSNAAGVFVSEISERAESDRVKRVILKAQANYEAYQLLRYLIKGAKNEDSGVDVDKDGYICFLTTSFPRAASSSLFKAKEIYPTRICVHYNFERSAIMLTEHWPTQQVWIGADTSKWQSN